MEEEGEPQRKMTRRHHGDEGDGNAGDGAHCIAGELMKRRETEDRRAEVELERPRAEVVGEGGWEG